MITVCRAALPHGSTPRRSRLESRELSLVGRARHSVRAASQPSKLKGVASRHDPTPTAPIRNSAFIRQLPVHSRLSAFPASYR